MDKDVLKEISALWDKINELSKQLSDYTGMRIDDITPYTDTKTAYIGDTEVTFYDVPKENVTVFFDKPYTMEKVADRLTLTFDALTESTDITISIL